jgi:hypothetical protein
MGKGEASTTATRADSKPNKIATEENIVVYSLRMTGAAGKDGVESEIYSINQAIAWDCQKVLCRRGKVGKRAPG